MSKIICDICGTVYPDNATVCPICGYPRQDSEKAILDDAEMQANAGRRSGTYVKGGRFSSKNVKKRQAAESAGEPYRVNRAENPHRAERPQKAQQPRTEQPFRQEQPPRDDTAGHAEQTVTQRPQQPEVSEQPAVQPEKQRPKAGPVLKGVVAVLAVAVVAVSGYIAYRFISGAGAYDKNDVPDGTESLSQTEEMPQDTTAPAQSEIPSVGLNISNESIAFSASGRAWILSVEPIPLDTTDPVVFTSSDEKVAIVNSQGRVTAVGPGKAVITITCGDIVREVQVVCDFEETADPSEPSGDAAQPTKPGETTAPTEATQGKVYKDQNWKMNNKLGDATLIIGEEFSLELKNDAGEIADVQWNSDNAGVVSIKGNSIKGEIVGMTNVSATIDGKTYTCIVRVIRNR